MSFMTKGRRAVFGLCNPSRRRRCYTLRSHLSYERFEPSLRPGPEGVVLTLDEAFRVLEAFEDARLELSERGAAPGLQDELATVIRMLHGKLGLNEGGVQ